MFDDFNICPYTGLRSFTEEESIYFKGRDEHIQQSTRQLEKNKFLMLTGASGDGKSSIVYAGIIPNARSGFLKSSFSNWEVADFRPERSPFENLCTNIAKALRIDSVSTVESELAHGFSALIDLYKSSELYYDKNSDRYQSSSEEDQRVMQQKSANLIILVDQFEEFFTNPENYTNGVPSVKATLTINLLLETARLALQDNLPIYVVFTMRSDFIGQCAAFRGLPEYIGFSQFFVPRLNRKLLQEVIEEPCLLSGNRISRRLTERIIHDMTDGVDQLPILQHALNQIWKAADNGNEEMDLIHYAMVGGLDPEDLPEEDKERFKTWFDAKPAKIRECFNERSLRNVLDTHANKLYVGSTHYLKEQTGKTISDELSHDIIRTVFTSLTKIDQSRAVRNRMTLQEICDILDNPAADIETIAVVIDQFREPGNTFVRPFINENEEKVPLTGDTVLDITHESLIRNWKLLRKWAKDEFEKFTVFKDFKQQVDRWIQHKKSRGFLLPIGSLTFFENWYDEAHINKSWVNRYNEQVTDTPKNLDESARIVADATDFLKRSSRKHMVTRAVVRLGPRRIAAVLGIIIILGLSSFFYYDYSKRTNAYVIRQLEKESKELLNSNKVPPNFKAENLIYRERLEEGNFFAGLDEVKETSNKLKIIIAAGELLVQHDRQGTLELKTDVLLAGNRFASELFDKTPKSHNKLNEGLADLTNLGELFEYYNYYYSRDDIEEAGKNSVLLLKTIVLHVIANPYEDLDVLKFNEAIEMLLNHDVVSPEEISQIITAIENNPVFKNSIYTKEKEIVASGSSDTFTYNGKYQVLGDLYAALGNLEATLESIDMILQDRPNYPEYPIDGLSIAGYFIRYNHWPQLDEFTYEYGKRIGYKPYEIYRQMANRSGVITQAVHGRFQYHYFYYTNNWDNPVLEYMPEDDLETLYDNYQKSIETNAPVGDIRAYNLAIFYKQKGLFFSKRFTDKQIPREDWISEVNNSYDNYIKWFAQISDAYLNESINVMFHTAVNMTRREVLTFPDYIEHVPSHRPRTRYSNYLSNTLLNYLNDNNLINEFYPTAREFEEVVTWVREYKNSIYNLSWNYEGNIISVPELQNIDSVFINSEQASSLNDNMILILLSENNFESGNTDLGIRYAERLDTRAIKDLYSEEFELSHHKTHTLIGKIIGHLMINDRADIAKGLIDSYDNIRNKFSMITRSASYLMLAGKDSTGLVLLDSIDNMYIKNRTELFGPQLNAYSYLTVLANDENSFTEGRKIIRNIGGFGRDFGNTLTSRAASYNNNLYDVYTYGISKFPSSQERLNNINQILYGQVYYDPDEEWQVYDTRSQVRLTLNVYFN